MSGSDKKRAVVLLSGGLDSSTVLAMARSEGLAVTALSFRYGQQHVFELEAAPVFRPFQDIAGSTDIRSLGVAVGEVEWE